MEDYEMEETVTSEHKDRLSELPNSLVLHILSFLPMREVVQTTLLSKRWNNLWTTVPCLDFDYLAWSSDNKGVERIRNFVNRALMFWQGTKILKFKIDFDAEMDDALAGDIDLWVRFAVQNKVEELKIISCLLHMAPQCLYSCSSIKTLSLEGYNLRIHGSPAWNQLKSLTMHYSSFSECVINQIMLGTPQLEVFDLRLLESYENLNILSGSLKKLKIKKYLDDNDPSLDKMLRICCPNLETLEVSGVSYCKCLFTNVSSLTDAMLGFDDPWHRYAFGRELLGETLRQILPTIQHIEVVTLSVWCIEVLGASVKKYPPLPNVKSFKLYVDSMTKIGDIMNFLGIFPNLKMLVIEDIDYIEKEIPTEFNADNFLEFETNLSESFLVQLKSIEITSDLRHASIYPFIGCLLKYACTLEKLVIRAKYVMSQPQTILVKVAEILLSMPRSSPTAKVIFKAS